MFAHLKKNHNSEIVVDHSEPGVDAHGFPCKNWSLSIYGGVDEDLPKYTHFVRSPDLRICPSLEAACSG